MPLYFQIFILNYVFIFFEYRINSKSNILCPFKITIIRVYDKNRFYIFKAKTTRWPKK